MGNLLGFILIIYLLTLVFIKTHLFIKTTPNLVLIQYLIIAGLILWLYRKVKKFGLKGIIKSIKQLSNPVHVAKSYDVYRKTSAQLYYRLQEVEGNLQNNNISFEMATHLYEEGEAIATELTSRIKELSRDGK